ncbi:amidohydrolase family protein [Nocardioides sp. AN3]
MKDGMFIFDAVIHRFDFRPSNPKLKPPIVDGYIDWVRGLVDGMATEGNPGNPDAFVDGKLDELSEANFLFDNSDTDMAMVQTVPLLDYWEVGSAPADAQAELAAAFPDKILFCGGVDPVMQGVRGAQKEMERQVKELGAKSFKFYQAQSRDLKWRADDRAIAYPLYEKAQELGVDYIQFHKGGAIGDQLVEDLRSLDMQGAALDFPDLTFGLHHLGFPYLDETFAVVSRAHNIVLVLPLWFNQYMIQPRPMIEVLGKALFEIGPDRLLYGSEAFLWPRVQTFIDAFDELEMPDDLQQGWGYPPITREIKEQVFGLNAARILGIDVEAWKAKNGTGASAETDLSAVGAEHATPVSAVAP